jgi:hypothetical protein
MPYTGPWPGEPGFTSRESRLSYQPPKKSPIDDKIEAMANEIRRDQHEALERITHQEFVRLIKEMIDSGDFEQLIQMGKMPGEITGSCLTYVPYRKCEELKREVAELKGKLLYLTKTDPDTQYPKKEKD